MSPAPVAQFIKARADASPEASANTLSLANAWARLVGPVQLSGLGFVDATGRSLVYAPDLGRALGLRGLVVRDLMSEGDDFTVTADNIPRGMLSGAWDAADFPAIYGPNNLKALSSWRDFWNKARKLGIWTKAQHDQIDGILASGLLVYPVAVSTLTAFQRDGSPAYLSPPDNPGAWNELVAKAKPFVSAYYRGQFDAATAAAAAAAADVAFWETVYKTVKAVADAPAAAVGVVSDAATGFLGGILRKGWPLLALAGLGLGLYVFAPSLLKKAKAAANG